MTVLCVETCPESILEGCSSLQSFSNSMCPEEKCDQEKEQLKTTLITLYFYYSV